jgi:uncharacterized protein (UPF0254 family)
MLAIWPFSSCRCFAHGGGATIDRARYDIISILGKRVTVVTSRFVDTISAGEGLRSLLGVYAPDGKMDQTIADDQWRLACAEIKNFATAMTTFVRRFDPSA